MTQTTIIINQSDVETQTVTIADIVNQTKERGSKFFTLHSIPANAPTRSLSLFTPAVIYRKQLKMYRRMAAWADRHETLVNVITAAQAVAFAIYIFLYY
jgi:hypothetical protein